MIRELISVIIPNYNYGRYLETAINSVLTQSYPQLEVIVVDDGSSDETQDILTSYRKEVTIISQENSGQSVARNRGILESRGTLVALLDADDFWESNKLEKQVELLSPRNLAVYSSIYELRGDGKILINAEARGDCRQLFYKYPGKQLVLGGESSLLFSKKLITKSGLFNSQLSICAGYDFYRRLSAFTEFDYVEEPLVYYRRHQSNLSSNLSLYERELRKIGLLVSSELPKLQAFKYRFRNEFTLFKSRAKQLSHFS
jgi:glycosyltransferase involved in cell wall biosynthesis